MSFMPTQKARLVPGFGRADAKIIIVGDYTTRFDDMDLRPFSGPNGTVLESCLHGAGLIKSDVYMTNTFKSKTKYPPKMANLEYYDEGKKKFTDLGMEHVAMLHAELNSRPSNVIIAAGNAAFHALTDWASVAKYRGYVCATTKLKEVRKLIPTFSPASTMRSYVNRHLIVADLKKAKLESDFPDIVRPERQIIYEYSGVEEALQWLQWLGEQPEIAFDIEVINYEVSCISFASSAKVAVVIPFGATDTRPQGWLEDEELLLWRAVQKVLGNPNTSKIVQNGSFDIPFLLTRCGIVVRGPIKDTMIAHSVMFPEFPKGLAFFGSIYCGSQEYWKDAVKFDNIKGES